MKSSRVENDPPLLELFNQLRQAGLPLGIEEYLSLLRALQGGFGIENRDTLARLCKMLWVKSIDEARLFDYLFSQVMGQAKGEEITLPSLQSPSSQAETSSPPIQAAHPSFPAVSSAKGVHPSTPDPTSKITFQTDTETVELADILLHMIPDKNDMPYNYFVQTDEYFPITSRQIKQSWRYLRRPKREGPLVEVDVKATVNAVGRGGILLAPVLVPRRINQVELLVLIDHGGSMVPFHALSHRLAETALRGGQLGKVGIYYFHNCPGEYLFNSPAHQEAKPIEYVLSALHSNQAAVLIFSDGGAARGGFNPKRIQMTEKFLSQLKSHIRYIAWLNPIPRSRWIGTTAGEVMLLVPTFDISRRGLDDSISVLRGRPTFYIRNEAKI